MRVTYGYQVTSADDAFVVLAATTNANLMRAVMASSELRISFHANRSNSHILQTISSIR